MGDVAIKQAQVAGTPAGYTVPGAQEIVIKSVKASFDGTSATTPFLPLLQIVDPGGTVMVECAAESAVAAGGTADVSWFPGLGGGGGGGGGITGQVQVRIPLVTPDASSFAYPSLTTSNGFTTNRLLLPYYTAAQTSIWAGSIPVPQNFKSAPQIVLSTVVNATTGVVRWIVATAVVAAGVTEDTAFTAEAAQNITVPGTALLRQDVTFNLSTTPAAGSTLNVRVERNGSNAADTCALPAAVYEAIFQFSV